MAYERKFKTDAELSAFRAEVARNRKVNRGGRKPVPPDKKKRNTSVCIWINDYYNLKRVAVNKHIMIADALHLAIELLMNHKPDVPPDAADPQ